MTGININTLKVYRDKNHFLRPAPIIKTSGQRGKTPLGWRPVDVLVAQRIKESIATGLTHRQIVAYIQFNGLRAFLGVPKRKAD